MATIDTAALRDLADWLDEKRDDGYDAGTLVESLDHKLRTLAGQSAAGSDLVEYVDPSRYRHLRAALMVGEARRDDQR